MSVSPAAAVTAIKDLKPGMNGLNLQFIVLDIGRPTTTKENQEVRTVKVADRSGMVNLSLWNEPGKMLQSGDIVRMSRGYTGMFKNCLTVYTTRAGEFYKIGEFCMIFTETPYMSEPNTELAAQFEREEAERKAEFAARKSGAAGRGGGNVAATGGGGGGGGNKTWGSNNTAANGGLDRAAPGNRAHQRGNSKEKR